MTAGLDDTFTGRAQFATAMAAYQQARDEQVLPIYGFTCELATLQPPPPELQQLIGAVSTDQDAMDGFVSVVAGTVSPAQFFAPENAGAIMASAAARAG